MLNTREHVCVSSSIVNVWGRGSSLGYDKGSAHQGLLVGHRAFSASEGTKQQPRFLFTKRGRGETPKLLPF